MEADSEKTTRQPRRMRARTGVQLSVLSLVLSLGGWWLWRQMQLSRLPPSLIRAVIDGNTNQVRILLEQGADPDIRCDYRPEPFTWRSIFSRLRRRKVGPPSEAETVLMAAANRRHPDIVRLLLEHGADVSIKMSADNLKTALEWAADRGDVDCMKTLIAHGADVNGRGQHGRPTLFYAIDGDSSDLFGLYRASNPHGESSIDLLLQHGANIEAVDNEGRTPLIFAAHGSVNSDPSPTLRRLLAHGAVLEARDREWRTALHHAVNYGSPEAVRTLLECGADIDAQDCQGKTVLMYAVRRADYEKQQRPIVLSKSIILSTGGNRAACLATIQLLLDKGADLNRKDQDGRTALDFAQRGPDPEVVALLRTAASQAPGADQELGEGDAEPP